MSERIGGTLFVKVNGVQVRAKGPNFTFNLGVPKKESLVGIDGYHGHIERPIAAYIEGTITDGINFDVKAFASLSNEHVTAQLANGKVISIKGAVQTAVLDQGTEEGEIPFRFEGPFGEEVS